MSVLITSYPCAAWERERKPMPAPSSRAAGLRGSGRVLDDVGPVLALELELELPAAAVLVVVGGFKEARYAASTCPPIQSVVPVVPVPVVSVPFPLLAAAPPLSLSAARCCRESTASRVGSGWCSVVRCFVAEAGRGEAESEGSIEAESGGGKWRRRKSIWRYGWIAMGVEMPRESEGDGARC
jgi:hypothetical protein